MIRTAVATAAILAPVAAQADTLQDQVVAAARGVSPTGFAFTQTTQAEQTGSAGKTYVSRYDPAQPPERRWTLVSVDGAAASAKLKASAAKSHSGEDPPSYAELAKWFGTPATRIAQTATSVTYRFPRLPAGIVKIGKHDASADTVAEALVDTSGRVPVVTRVRYVSSTPFRMALVAKVERYVFLATFRVGADGQPVPATTTGDISGSLLGKSGSITTRTTFTDVRAIR
jgi:hypothetical protein